MRGKVTLLLFVIVGLILAALALPSAAKRSVTVKSKVLPKVALSSLLRPAQEPVPIATQAVASGESGPARDLTPGNATGTAETQEVNELNTEEVRQSVVGPDFPSIDGALKPAPPRPALMRRR